MKLGVNLWTVYGWKLPGRVSENVLARLAELGVEALELVVDEDQNSSTELLARRDETWQALSDYNLAVPSIASALFWRYNLGARDESVRRHAVKIVADMCHVARAYGAGVILIVAGQQEPHTPYAQTWDNAVRSIRQAARVAGELDVLIGVENVGTNFLITPGEMAQFIADVDHPNVGCYLDLGNAMYVFNGYPENWCTALAGKIVAVHVKDYHKESRQLTYCGHGDLPWGEVLPVLKACGYDGYLMAETPSDRPGDVDAGLEAARLSYEGIRQYVVDH